jgi:hypothetical protein
MDPGQRVAQLSTATDTRVESIVPRLLLGVADLDEFAAQPGGVLIDITTADDFLGD